MSLLQSMMVFRLKSHNIMRLFSRVHQP